MKVIYHDNDFIIGDKESLLENLKEHMFYNRIEDEEGIVDSYNNYWDMVELFENVPEKELYIMKFHQMDGSPYLGTEEELKDELLTLINQGELIFKSNQ